MDEDNELASWCSMQTVYKQTWDYEKMWHRNCLLHTSQMCAVAKRSHIF